MNDLNRARETLFSIYQAALERVSGRETVKRWLYDSDHDCSMIAIGKAAGDMAQGAVDQLGNHIIDGWVISKSGHLEHKLLQSYGLETMEAGHPVPDQQSLAAGARLLDYLEGLPEDRPLLFLISGGASSLIEALRPGITLADLERVNKWLLASGLSITDMNRVRCSLSLIKGGGLLRYIGRRPADVLLISDVPKDDPAVIGSGLLIPPADGAGLPTYLKLPEWILALTANVGGTASSPIAGDNVSVHVIASLRDAREAAAAKARMLGYEVTLRHAHICADAVSAGRRLALELNDADPGVFVWGGEPSVQLPESPGRGGRNQHLALSAATVIAGHDDVYFLSLATDGGDGPGDDAGALVDGGTVRRGEREGFNAKQALDAADSGSFLEASGDLINTGPTGTNVMDLILGIKL